MLRKFKFKVQGGTKMDESVFQQNQNTLSNKYSRIGDQRAK